MTRRAQGKWVRCPPGEFQRLAQKLNRRRQRRYFLCGVGAATAGAAVALAAGGVLWLGRQPRDARPPPPAAVLSCAQVKAYAVAYGKKELSDGVIEQIRRHLASCTPCREYYRGLGLFTRARSPVAEV